MSNLSFARIMYGSNEDSAVSTWMHSSSLRLPVLAAPAHSPASEQSWMQKLLSVVMPNRESNSRASSKKSI